MKNSVTITKSTDGLTSAQVQIRDTNEMQSIMSSGIPSSYTVVLKLPDNGGQISLSGTVTNFTVNPGEDGVTASLQITEDTKLYDEVYVGVAYASDLLPDLKALYDDDRSLKYIVYNSTTSGMLAQEIAFQAGMTLQWDTRLDYYVVTLLDPLYLFKGTVRDGLRALLNPFDVGGHRLYSLTISGDVISVHYTGADRPGYITPTLLNVGLNTHIIGAPIINLTTDGGTEALDYWWCEPNTIEELTSTTATQISTGAENSLELPFNVKSETVTKTTSLGGITLSISSETEKDQFGYWAVSSTENTEYTYAPAPTETNIFYRADMVLSEVKTTVTSYRVALHIDGTRTVVPMKTEIKHLAYKYAETGSIESEITTEYIEREITDLGFEGTVTERLYDSIAPGVLRVTDRVTEYTQSGDLLSNASEVTTSTTIQPGAPPSPPSATVGEDTLSTTYSGSVTADAKFSGSSQSIGFPFNPESKGVVDDIKKRMDAKYFQCSMTLKSSYDIEPGSWVRFIFPTDCVYTTNCEGGVQSLNLSTLFSLLPTEMRVVQVSITQDGSETLCSLDLEGWKNG